MSRLAEVAGLEVVFTAQLTDADGTIDISNSYAFTLCTPGQCSGASVVAQGTIGTAVSSSAVPGPAALAFLVWQRPSFRSRSGLNPDR